MGIGLETKYTLAVVLVLLVATFVLWRRDVLRSWGFLLAAAIAAALVIPNLVWQAGHGWVSVHWFLNPPTSASDEPRRQFVVDMILLAGAAIPVAVAGVVSLIRDRVLRPLGWTVAGTVTAYLVLGGKSYDALPTVVFALAAGAAPLDRWIARRLHRLLKASAAFAATSVLVLPILLPVLPLHTAVRLGVVKARSDYQSEVGWPAYVGLVERYATGVSVILASNYGEAGALDVLGHGLPPVTSADVTMRYWRPGVTGRSALVIGYSRPGADFCDGYRLVARISGANDSDEGASRSRAARSAGRSPGCGRASSRPRTRRRRLRAPRHYALRERPPGRR